MNEEEKKDLEQEKDAMTKEEVEEERKQGDEDLLVAADLVPEDYVEETAEDPESQPVEEGKKFTAEEIKNAVNKVCKTAFKTRAIRERTAMAEEIFIELKL